MAGERNPGESGIVGPARTPAQVRGATAEVLAERYLVRNGLAVLARNVRCRAGEIDLVCRDRDLVVFVEVRLRTPGRFGDAAASITAHKRRRILMAARWWLSGAGRRHAAAPCRFDAVLLDALEERTIRWIPGAFDEGL